MYSNTYVGVKKQWLKADEEAETETRPPVSYLLVLLSLDSTGSTVAFIAVLM